MRHGCALLAGTVIAVLGVTTPAAGRPVSGQPASKVTARLAGATAVGSEPRATMSQSPFGRMPVADPSKFQRGAPAPTGQPVGIGEYRPKVQPGSTPEPKVSCRRSGRGRFRCQVSLAGQVIQTCRGRGRATTSARRACLRRASRNTPVAGAASARIARLGWNGWPSQAMPSVGRLNIDGGTCSGTMVTRSLMLTAAHCVYSATGFARAVTFTPGAALGSAQPYGTWNAYAWWVPNEYLAGDMSMDFAFVEIPPLTNGTFLGDLIGVWDITPNISWGVGAQAYLVGYPQSGFWASAPGYLGRGQYACDSRWDGQRQLERGGSSIVIDCTMNQGASGGPWFVKLNTGRWTIGGVNSRCTAYAGSAPDRCDPYAINMLTSFPDQRFYTLWNAVRAQLHW